MANSNVHGVFVFVFVYLVAAGRAFDDGDDVPFAQNYNILYGNGNVNFVNRSMEAQISLDQHSGSGFGSISNYSSGFFQMRIKIPNKDSTCILTTFYLKSQNEDQHHDELDFEFYGGKGLPYQLQTNVYANGVGGREQKVSLWFDPTADFHTYQILWNQHQAAFFVDNTPIRVFKNNSNIGVSYPWQPMRIEATIWEANWTCHGNESDWSQAPFRANYQGFGVQGCQSQNLGDEEECYSSKNWWNEAKYWNLDAAQNEAYKDARRKYLSYDYCTDKSRYPNGNPECKHNEPY